VATRAAAAQAVGHRLSAAPLTACAQEPRADLGAYSGPLLHRRLRERISAWAQAGASKRVLTWLRDGVQISWNEKGAPPHFHHGVSTFTAAERAWLTLEKQRCLASGAWAPATHLTHVSRTFVAYHNGKPRLVIDLRFINTHTRKRACRYETLSTLRRMIQARDWMFSVDLTDAYHHIPFHPSSVHYFTFGIETLTSAGAVCTEYFHTPVLNFGWTNSPSIFTEIMRVPVAYIRRPPLNSSLRPGIRVLPYLDDFAFFVDATSSNDEATSSRDAIHGVFNSLGIVLDAEFVCLLAQLKTMHHDFVWPSALKKSRGLFMKAKEDGFISPSSRSSHDDLLKIEEAPRPERVLLRAL